MVNKRTRGQKILINSSMEILLEIVTAICSFVLPRLLLTSYGSKYNGIVSSISQFIGCISLFKAGIGSVTRAELYKPLAENDTYKISEIVSSTEKYMKKIALIFSIFIIAFSIIYPIFVSNEFDWIFSSTLVLILSISTFAQYFFGLTYQMVLQADQSNYIISIVSIITTIINTIISVILIKLNFSIHIVKLASASIFVLSPIFYCLYVRNKYKIDKNIKPNMDTISQRWDAFAHQVANFINNNTDIILITIFLSMNEVSVYSIYFMIVSAIKKFIYALSSGFGAAFGNMIAKNEKKILKKRFSQYEFFIYAISTFLFTSTFLLILPFINIYVKGVTDTNYIRFIFAALICISEFFSCVKKPYEEIIFASGHFKSTKRTAYIEAFINIFVSIVLIQFIGIEGVIIGTICAMFYRTIAYNYYVSKVIINRNSFMIAKSFIYSIIIIFISMFLLLISDIYINSYLLWFINAIAKSSIVLLVTIFVSKLMFKTNYYDTKEYIINLLKGKFNVNYDNKSAK